MIKTDTFLAEIIDTGMDGEGVAKINNIPVFIPFAAKGDLVKIKIELVKKSYAKGKIVKVVRPSPDRCAPVCKSYGVCGGCALQHITFDAENVYKRNGLISTLKKTGIDFPIDTTVADKQYCYRNKLQMPFAEIDGKVCLGFYKKGTHDVVPLTECSLHDDWAKQIIGIVTKWANFNFKYKFKVYDETSGKGLLRHLVARMIDGVLSVVIVINGKSLPFAKALYDSISEVFECQLFISPNTERTNVIMGNTVKKLFGVDKEISVSGIKLRLSPLSFLQVNDGVRELLYQAVSSEIGEADIVFDVYSGVGIMTAMIANKLPNAQLQGIEIVKEAVANADELVASNNLGNRMINHCGDAAELLPILSKEIFNGINTRVKPQIAVIIDPPRKGCDVKVLKAVINAKADKVVYISCNPSTLARDLKILTEFYVIKKITPFNMFPRTAELETLAIMEFKKSIR